MNETECRICANVLVEGAHISSIYRNKFNILNIIFDLTSLQIEINDKLPNSICKICADKLVDYHLFRLQILDAEGKLAIRKGSWGKTDDIQFVNVKKEFAQEAVFSADISKNDAKRSNKISEDFDQTEQGFQELAEECTIENTKQKAATDPDRKKFQCDKCRKIFPVPSKFIAHYRSVHLKEYERRACPYCPRTFKASSTTRYSLRRHIKIAHEGVEKATAKHATIRCIDCDSLFAGPIEMYEHSKVHDTETIETKDGLNLNCEECHIPLKSYDKFLIHQKNQHNVQNESDIRPFKCRWCGERSKKLVGLYSHVRLVHKFDEHVTTDIIPSNLLNKTAAVKSKTRKFLCMMCGKVLSSLSAYNNHLVIHSGVKSFSCEFCSAKFSGKPLLQSHLLTHTQERKYKCSECEKAFKQCAHLKSHLKTHGIGIKEKFPCTVCNKEFLFRGSLREHMWVHKKDEAMPYVCKKCGKGFHWNCKLELHLKKGRCC